jgi:glutamyl-tRNA reductase
MKKIICVELTHKLAPVSIREKAALNKNQTISILTNLKKHYEEIFAISTCNRLSFYAKGDDANPLIECFQQLGINDEYLQIILETQRSVYNLFTLLRSRIVDTRLAILPVPIIKTLQLGN